MKFEEGEEFGIGGVFVFQELRRRMGTHGWRDGVSCTLFLFYEFRGFESGFLLLFLQLFIQMR